MGKLSGLRDDLMHDDAFRAGYDQRSRLVRFGRMLRRAREAQELTQAQLAEKLGTNQSEISKLEKGEGINGPTFDRMVSVAHALNLSLVVGFADEHVERELGHPPKMLSVGSVNDSGTSLTAEAAAGAEPLWSAF